jgi:hypothetical protein
MCGSPLVKDWQGISTRDGDHRPARGGSEGKAELAENHGYQWKTIFAVGGKKQLRDGSKSLLLQAP